MGSGASTPEAEAHLRKWESAVNDLQQLCQDNRKALGMPSARSAKSRSEADENKSERELVQSFRGRRTSSLVSFGSGERGKISPQNQPQVQVDEHPAPPISPKESGRSRNAHTAEFSPQAKDQAQSPGHRIAREQIVQIKKTRSELYKSYEAPDGTKLQDIEGIHACSHYAVIAAGLSALLGGRREETDRKKRVTVEDLFFSAQIPLKALHDDRCVLSEVYDVIREFVDVDNRFKETPCSVECVHLDIAPVVGQVDLEGNEVGDRQTRVSLSDLRKAIQSEIEEEDGSVRFVYYDPYIVQQAMTLEEEDDDDSTEPDDLMTSLSKKPAVEHKISRENHGHMSVLVDFRNSVQPMVTVAEAVASDRIYTQLKEIPLAALYKAMRAPQPTGRAGGYIRVSLKRSEAETNKEDVSYLFSPELCSGKVLGTKTQGNDAHCTSPHISRHLGAVGWALHFLGGMRPNTHNHGNGLPISNIIRELGLPIDVFMRCDLPLDQVHLYVKQYFEQTHLDREYRATLCPVLTKANRPDAPPTLSIFDLEAVLIDVKSANADPESPSHLMILQYNADIAHNVINIAYHPQWCVLVGYDEDLQMARVIDANALRFSGSWTIPLERLHKAITNYGYIMIAKHRSKSVQSLGASTSSREGSPKHAGSDDANKTPIGQSITEEIGVLRHINSTLQARFDLLGSQASHFPIEDVFEYFVFPSEPLPITQIAMVLTRLGVHTTVEAILHALPYDINALIAPSLSLHTMELLFKEYSERVAAVAALNLAVEVRHADRIGFDKKILLSDFVAWIQTSVGDDNQIMLINYHRESIHIFGAKNPCGEFGFITKYDADAKIVTVADVNANRFFRTWKVDVKSLYEAMYVPSTQFRARGLLMVTRNEKPIPVSNVPSRPCNLACVPLQNVFSVSPSPQIQALSFAFAQLSQFFSPEEIFYEAYLKTMNDQRRRGSQAFAWRDVEISMSMLNKITVETTMKIGKKFLESRKVFSLAVEVVEDVEEDDLEELFKEGEAFGENPQSVYLANYNTEKAHNVQNMGNSMAIIRSYDPATKTVGLFEAELCQFGLHWSCPLSTLIEACDLRNEGKSDYGILKVYVKDENESSGGPKIGFTAFGGGAPDNNTLEVSQPPRQRNASPRATFIEE